MANRLFKQLAGQRFGRVLVEERVSLPGECSSVRWRCKCDCGTTFITTTAHLTNSTAPTRSCGCLRKENALKANTKHGQHKSPEYQVWENIIQRCTNPKHPKFHNHGGRGITVCDRWRNSFSDFLSDVGPRPTPRHTIERRNNDLGYEPDNCYWATYAEQNRNRRNNRYVTLDGKTLVLEDWAKLLGIPPRTLHARFHKGWPPELILSTKSFRGHKNVTHT